MSSKKKPAKKQHPAIARAIAAGKDFRGNGVTSPGKSSAIKNAYAKKC